MTAGALAWELTKSRGWHEMFGLDNLTQGCALLLCTIHFTPIDVVLECDLPLSC